MNKTLKEIIYYSNQMLSSIYQQPDEANTYTCWIIEHILDINLGQILISQDRIITDHEFETLKDILVKHINKNMPLQYIFGQVPFLDLNIKVKEPILIPRPETEYWCQEILKQLEPIKNEKLMILDLCTGSGCIALSFAKHLKNSHIFAVDINPKACELTLENAKNNNIDNITIIKSDLYHGLNMGLKFDIILSNPPYISFDDWQNLDLSVKNWEDKIALASEDNGLYLIKKIISDSKNWLNYNKKLDNLKIPQIIIEIGYDQGEPVKNIFQENNFTDIKVNKDLSLKERFVCAGFPIKPIL